MEKRLKVTLKWYFYFFTFAAFVFQDHGAHSAMAGGSVCCNTTSSILYVVNQEVTDEVTIQAVASFMRRTYHRLNSTGQSTQAAIAMIFQLFRERQSCWGMSFEPRDTMEEDIKQIQYYGKFSKDCNKAYRKNVESMKTSLLGSSGLDPADRLFVFIIDLDLPLDFFRVNKGIDVKSFVIFTHWRFSKRRVLPEDFNFYYKNQEQLTIENILHFEGPRAFNRSVPDVVDDIYREDENVVHQALVTREEDTIARLRFDDTERNVTWAYGKDICARRGMYLLSPRTSFEADRVADTIMQMAGNKSQDAQLKRTEFNVYIGLRRSKTSHGHRFEWTEGSNTLFYSKWAEGEPTDMTECVYWQFRQNDNGTVENVGWRSGSCGAAVVVVSVCQARIYALRHPMRVPDNISPVNDSELYAKGNFIKVKVNDHITIMALSQAVASGRLQQLFRDVDYVDIGGLVSHEMVRIGSREKEILLAALDPLFHVCKRSRWSVSADRKRNGVSLAEVCDGRPQCFTRSDEYGCRGLGHANCTSKFFTCRSSECVPLQYKCDLVYDCADGSDEDDCEDSECKHMQCSDGTCLPKPWHTDGQQDCENADDAPQKLSGSKTKDVCLFTCQRNECINKQKLEDDTRDCVGPEGPLDVTLKPAGSKYPRNTRRICLIYFSLLGGATRRHSKTCGQ
ncbi:hypothetical protein RRG08_059065 [Elysia crispata]|uniref:C-type lectin domain-containing protein n=1 Tax=Elysia crispata TaxID=231223 RepID=A0AAE1EBG6_9GAST|nr:hypothetical protein RRG08_059065 [Elysia crispata]